MCLWMGVCVRSEDAVLGLYWEGNDHWWSLLLEPEMMQKNTLVRFNLLSFRFVFPSCCQSLREISQFIVPQGEASRSGTAEIKLFVCSCCYSTRENLC